MLMLAMDRCKALVYRQKMTLTMHRRWRHREMLLPAMGKCYGFVYRQMLMMAMDRC